MDCIQLTNLFVSAINHTSLVKSSSEDEDQKPYINELSNYLCLIRAMYLLHQQNHWYSINYGNHLLFQRLYEDMVNIVDDTAEKIMGLCGSINFSGKESELANSYFLKSNSSMKELLESSLKIEKDFQELSSELYNQLKQDEALTLGLDDLIMSQASSSETHIYLLQQALKDPVL